MKRATPFSTFLYASAALIGIVVLTLGTIWALLKIGGGDATIKFRKYGADCTFGGTCGLFIALVTLFTRTFKTLLKIVSSIIVTSIGITSYVTINQYITQQQRDTSSFWKQPAPDYLAPDLNINIFWTSSLFFTFIISIIIIAMWFVFRRWRDQVWSTE